MAKKGSRNGVSSLQGFSFVDVRLSGTDKQWLAAADLDKEFPIEMLFDLVSQQYKASLTFDSKNSSFIVSITDKATDSQSKNSVLSGRGSTLLNAWYSLAYKHFRVLDGEWQNADSSGGGSRSDFD